MYDEPLECRRCGVVGSQASQLCQPVLLLDTCLDHSSPRGRTAPNMCKPLEDTALYSCAVCARPAIEALSICYPRRRSAAPPAREEGAGRGAPRPK